MTDKLPPGTKPVQPETDSKSRPSVTFETVTFSDGTVIKLAPQDVVVFVGPNNAGKSAAMRDLEQHIGSATRLRVITSVTLRRVGDHAQIRELLDKQRWKYDLGQNQDAYRGFRFNFSGSPEQMWDHGLHFLRGLFCVRISTETRIGDSNSVNSIHTLEQPPSHPSHLVYLDERIEQRLNNYFRRAFNKDLILYRLGGGQLPFLVGDRLVPEAGEDRLSQTYNERVMATTVPLQQQGDGMRSFASVILHLLADDIATVRILDEPEAFLHPPQARLLGEFIATERPAHSQLFVATHSPDVLQGLLGSVADQLRIIRIQRDGSVNKVKELDNEIARNISRDPLMKFSGVLSGIFHHRVIICESDADCMLYSSILDLPEVRGYQEPDVLFVHAGGKHRMAALAEALRALDVIVDIVADIDVLREESVIERIVRVLGGDWNDMKADAASLKNAIEKHKPWLNAGEISKGIREVLDRTADEGEFPRDKRAEIDSIFRKATPWDAIKGAGKAAVPSGQATQTYNRLQNGCKAIGLWIVPVGELEGFCRAEGGHGPRWVQQVLRRDIAKDPELKEVRDFVKEIWRRAVGRLPPS